MEIAAAAHVESPPEMKNVLEAVYSAPVRNEMKIIIGLPGGIMQGFFTPSSAGR